jgi:hypothetical protein
MQGQMLRTKRRWPRAVGIAVGVTAAALVGAPILIGALGLLVGLVAGVVALVVALAVGLGPWFLLCYAGYRLARRPRAAVAAQPPAAPAPPVPGPVARLPEEQRAQADRIRRKASDLLERTGRFPTGSRNLLLVQRTLDSYLPSTLNLYLALPPGADGSVVSPDGRTGLQVLRDQLTILETKLDEVASDLWQADVQRLLANERFLEDHFGRREPDELTIR